MVDEPEDADDDEGSDEGASKALLAQPVSTSRLPVARSLADAAVGEMLFVGGRGQVLTRRQVTSAWAAYWALVVGGGATVGLVYGALISPTVGVIAGVAVELLAIFKLRHWPRSAARWLTSPPAAGRPPIPRCSRSSGSSLRRAGPRPRR